jgi:hypothetical protein
VLLTNLSGGVFNLRSDAVFERMGPYIDGGSARCVLHNAGTLAKLAGPGVSAVKSRIDFHNEGLIEIRQGTLALAGPLTSPGALTVAAGARLRLTGSPVTLQQPAGTVGAGFIEIPAGTVRLSGVVEQLRLTGGVLQGTFTLAGTNEWSGGLVQQARITIPTNGVWRVTGDRDWRFEEVTLNNAGLIHRTGTGRWVAVLNSRGAAVLITNLPSGTVRLDNDTDLKRTGPYADGSSARWVVHNAGLLLKEEGTTVTEVGRRIDFLNYGTMRVASGGWRFPYGLSSGGRFEVAAGAAVTFTGGTVRFEEGHRAEGEGFFGVPGGTVSLRGVAEGMLHWTGGKLLSSELSIPAGARFWIGGEGAKQLEGVTLNNAGVLDWEGSGPLRAVMSSRDAAVLLTNLSGGVFNLRSDAVFERMGPYIDGGSARCVLHNAGTLAKLAGPGVSTVKSRIDFYNEGLLELRQGTLEIRGRFHQGGEGALRTGIAGTMPGRDYGRLLLNGPATLGGEYQAFLTDEPAPGQFAEITPLEATNVEGGFTNQGLVPLGYDYSGLLAWRKGRLTMEIAQGARLYVVGLENGRFTGQFVGNPDTDYELQASDDCRAWEPLETFRSESGLFEWTDGTVATRRQRCFRVVQPGSGAR